MPARLTLHLVQRPVQVFLLEEGRPYILGRGRECDLIVEDDRVSRRHAELRSAAGQWILTDLGSKNGTAMDGQAVRSTPLGHQAWLSFGGVPSRFEMVSEAARRVEREAQLRRWRTSLEMQRQLLPSLGLEGLLERVLHSFLTLSGAERGFILLARRDGDLEVVSAARLAVDELTEREFSGSIGAISQVLQSGRPVATADAQAETALQARPSVVAGGIRALLCVPLTVLERLLGVIYADSRQPGTVFTELDVEILGALASHAALAIALARLDHELRDLVGSLPGESGRELVAAWERSLMGYRPEAAARLAPVPDSRPTTWTALLAAHEEHLGVSR